MYLFLFFFLLTYILIYIFRYEVNPYSIVSLSTPLDDTNEEELEEEIDEDFDGTEVASSSLHSISSSITHPEKNEISTLDNVKDQSSQPFSSPSSPLLFCSSDEENPKRSKKASKVGRKRNIDLSAYEPIYLSNSPSPPLSKSKPKSSRKAKKSTKSLKSLSPPPLSSTAAYSLIDLEEKHTYGLLSPPLSPISNRSASSSPLIFCTSHSNPHSPTNIGSPEIQHGKSPIFSAPPLCHLELPSKSIQLTVSHSQEKGGRTSPFPTMLPNTSAMNDWAERFNTLAEIQRVLDVTPSTYLTSRSLQKKAACNLEFIHLSQVTIILILRIFQSL
jgi:hypothetical protein